MTSNPWWLIIFVHIFNLILLYFNAKSCTVSRCDPDIYLTCVHCISLPSSSYKTLQTTPVHFHQTWFPLYYLATLFLELPQNIGKSNAIPSPESDIIFIFFVQFWLLVTMETDVNKILHPVRHSLRPDGFPRHMLKVK